MKKVKYLVSVISGGAALVFGALPAYAIDLCVDSGGIKASGLCGVTIETLIPQIVNLFLLVAFVSALIYLIYGGIRWIMSGGDKESTAKAKNSVTAALIGLAIVLGSWVLINLILNFFGSTGGLKDITIPKLIG